LALPALLTVIVVLALALGRGLIRRRQSLPLGGCLVASALIGSVAIGLGWDTARYPLAVAGIALAVEGMIRHARCRDALSVAMTATGYVLILWAGALASFG
jgi:hypothetical protein